jgi:hypothetical protein
MSSGGANKISNWNPKKWFSPNECCNKIMEGIADIKRQMTEDTKKQEAERAALLRTLDEKMQGMEDQIESKINPQGGYQPGPNKGPDEP